MLAALALVFLAPPLLALGGGWPGAAGWGWSAGLAMALAYAPTLRRFGLSPLRGLALPAIAAAYMVFTLDSALAEWRGRGGMWKGEAGPRADRATGVGLIRRQDAGVALRKREVRHYAVRRFRPAAPRRRRLMGDRSPCPRYRILPRRRCGRTWRWPIRWPAPRSGRRIWTRPWTAPPPICWAASAPTATGCSSWRRMPPSRPNTSCCGGSSASADPAREARIGRYLRRLQAGQDANAAAAGRCSMAGRSTSPARVKAYFALRLIGDAAEAPHMRARPRGDPGRRRGGAQQRLHPRHRWRCSARCPGGRCR